MIDFEAVPGSQELIVHATFAFPREKVFAAHIDPAAIPKWWGPARYQTRVENMEVWVGGVWKFISLDPTLNQEFAFHGIYHEIYPSERLVQTFVFEGPPEMGSLETLTLDENQGRTLLTARTFFRSVEERDGMLQGDCEAGMRETYDRLDAYLAGK